MKKKQEDKFFDEYTQKRKKRGKMDKTDTEFKEKILKLKTKLVIYRNVLGNKNIKTKILDI